MDIEAKVAANSEQIKSLQSQLEEMKAELKDFRALTVAVEKLALNVNTVSEKVDKVDSRLEIIEKEPVKTYTNIKQTIIAAIISFLVGLICSNIAQLFVK